jgi:hypothetical protein
MTKRDNQAAECAAEQSELQQKIDAWTDWSWIRRGKDLHHAYQQGLHASEWSGMKCGYSIGSDWRWVWCAGYDIGRQLRDIHKRHSDNLKFIDMLIADKAVAQSAKQELAKVFGDLTLTELVQKAIETKRFLDQEIIDWAETDTYIREQAAKVLPDEQVHGDGDYVPPIEYVVDKLVECISPTETEDA